MRNQRLFLHHLLLGKLRLTTTRLKHVDLLRQVDELVLRVVLPDTRVYLSRRRGDGPILDWLRAVCRLPKLEVLRLVLAIQG